MSGCERHLHLFLHRCFYLNEEDYKQFLIRANDTFIQCQGSDIIDFIKYKSARLG